MLQPINVDAFSSGANNNRPIPTNAGKIINYKRGDGHIAVKNSRTGNGKVDIILIEDITLNESSGWRRGSRDPGESLDDLIIELGHGDSIKMIDFFRDQANTVFDVFLFSDATLDLSDVYAAYPSTVPLESIYIPSVYADNLTSTRSDAIATSQELSLLVDSIASFDSTSSNSESLITSESTLTQPLITTSSY